MKPTNEKHFFLQIATCIATEGKSRGMICDTSRGQYFLVPNTLVQFLHDNNRRQLTAIASNYKEDAETLQEYLEFLYRNDICEFLPDATVVNNFPDMDLSWDYPAFISNAIWDINEEPEWAEIPNRIVRNLDELLCAQVQIRFYKVPDLAFLKSILHQCNDSNLKGVEISLNYDADIDYNQLLSSFPRITKCIVFDSPPELLQSSNKLLIFLDFKSIMPLGCGVVHHSYFAPFIPHFTESQHHNTCLNRKIAIDAEGNIKNCPSMKESYGNIRDTTLMEAIEKPGFKKYWNITKDQISVCKDCEFRHVCTDCRAYIENPEDIYSKPLKCGYNPYTCEWEEWSTHPMKQQAIEYYGMGEIVAERQQRLAGKTESKTENEA